MYVCMYVWMYVYILNALTALYKKNYSHVNFFKHKMLFILNGDTLNVFSRHIKFISF